MQKLDPYLNVDPGTMNPFQHGEVFVTEDGAETDLDVGHYERFLDVNLVGSANVTTGQVYSQVIAKERRGEYLGDTVQVIPHITDEIKSRMRSQADEDIDVIITEIGGTVGDIESLPFLEAARQVRHDLGRDNVFFLHVSLVPYIGPSGELKTKPTQHSVAALRSIGIQPDAIVLRADRDVPEATKRKIALMCDVDVEGVVTAKDAPSIYDIPRVLHSEGLDAYVVQRLGPAVPRRRVEGLGRAAAPRAPAGPPRRGRARRQVHRPARRLPVRDRGAARRRLPPRHQGRHPLGARPTTARRPRVPGSRSRASTRSSSPAASACAGIEGKLGALRWSRENLVPTLGICLGLQCMVIEYSRTVLGLDGASSSEFDADPAHPVIATMAEQLAIVGGDGDLGGTMRLGAYEALLTPGSVVAETYGATKVSERHRHRYEVNNSYRDKLEEAGLVISGVSPDTSLVEFVELPRDVHPYYVATQAHPEFKSRPTRAHPLFAGLIGAALAQRGDES